MWSCDQANSKSCGPIGHVLNGNYPEADLRRMSLTSLERLVAKLVQCTADTVGAKNATNKPKWWPSGLTFTHPIDLGLDDEREVKLAFKQLIVNCSQFFKERTEWNDENRKGGKRKHEEKLANAPDRKRFRAFVELPPRACEPFIPLQDCLRVPPPAPPSKNQFLHYFELSPRLSEAPVPSKAPLPPHSAKLTTCIHIPFSSDVGRIMAEREQHRMPEDLKLKRLERSEWYTNKAVPRIGETEFELAPSYKEPTHLHRYKMPKRQQHHERRSLRNAEFLKRFCTPLSVNVIRLDLDMVNNNKKTKKELVVVIGNSEKMCCDIRTDSKNVRTSPRLKNV